MKRKWLCLVAALTAIMLLAACGGNSNSVFKKGSVEVSKLGVLPIVKDKITLKAFTTYHSPSQTDFVNNEFSEWLEKQTNIRIEWEVIGAQDRDVRLNIMMATNDYPDIIYNTYFTPAQQQLYGSSGMLLPLNDLIDKYGFYIKKFFEENKSMYNDMVAEDGNIYALPTFGAAVHPTVPNRMWVYKPWLDKLGIGIPQTTEEFYQMLKAFKEKDPNGNGLTDEIPFIGATKGWNTNVIPFIMNSFIYTSAYQKNAVVTDGKVKFIYNDDKYKEGLKYLNKLFTEGLIAPESFTQDDKQLMSLTSGKNNVVGVVPGGYQGSFSTITDGEKGRWSEFVPLPPLTGPDGTRFASYAPEKGAARFSITNKCANPEAAIKLADLFYKTEVFMNSMNGLKGKYWDDAAPGDIGIDGNPAKWKMLNDGANEKNYCWSQISCGAVEKGFHSARAIVGDRNYNLEVILYNAAKEYLNYIPKEDMLLPLLSFEEARSKEIVDIEQSLSKYLEEKNASFIIKGKIDEEWNKYLAELEKIGIKKLVEIYQQSYDKKIKSLNK